MKDRDSSTKMSGFVRGMIIYAAVFLFLLVLLLLFFNFFLQKYEASRPAYAVSSYIDSLESSKISGLLEQSGITLNPAVQTHDEAAEELETILKNTVYIKNKYESSDNSYSYYLEENGTPVLHFVLTQDTEKGPFGFNGWAVTKEELLTDGLIKTAEYEIPGNYSISSNGRTLDDSCKSEGNASYGMLEGFSSEFKNLPHLDLYSAGPYFGNLDISIYDESGNKVPEESLQDGFYCFDNCTNTEKSALKTFCEAFVLQYVKYASGYDGNVSGDLETLLQMVDKKSDIYGRIKDSLGGMAFVTSYDEVKDIKINHYMNCGNGLYCCDITYQVETTSKHGTTNNEYSYKLLLQQQSDGSYLVIGMSVE